MMARTALLVVALLFFASVASAAVDCSSITGCKACEYVKKGKKGDRVELMCTACAAPAYLLKVKHGRCGESLVGCWIPG